VVALRSLSAFSVEALPSNWNTGKLKRRANKPVFFHKSTKNSKFHEDKMLLYFQFWAVKTLAFRRQVGFQFAEGEAKRIAIGRAKEKTEAGRGMVLMISSFWQNVFGVMNGII